MLDSSSGARGHRPKEVGLELLPNTLVRKYLQYSRVPPQRSIGAGMISALQEQCRLGSQEWERSEGLARRDEVSGQGLGLLKSGSRPLYKGPNTGSMMRVDSSAGLSLDKEA